MMSLRRGTRLLRRTRVNAPFAVTHGTTTETAVTLNQSVSPDDLTIDGTAWERIGTYTVTATALAVVLSQNATTDVIADAIRIVRRPKTTFEYNEFGAILRITDALGNETQQEYDSRERLSKVIGEDPDGSSTEIPETSFLYDAFGNLTSVTELITNALSRTTGYSYDALNRTKVITEPYADSSVDADIIIDDNDITTGYSENAGTWINGSGGQGGDHRVTTSSAAWANWTFDSLVPGKRYEVYASWPAGGTSSVTFKLSDDTTLAETVNVNQTNVSQSDYTENNVAFEYLGTLTVDSGTLVVDLSRSSGNTSLFADGVRIIEARPITTFEYDNARNLKSTTDGMGAITSYRFDARHRMITLTEEMPVAASTNPITKLTYDAASQLVAITDPLSRVARFNYDDVGRQVMVGAPFADITASSYAEDITPTSGVNWSGSGGAVWHDGSGTGSVPATWSITGLTVGESYEILVEWNTSATGQSVSSHATNATFTAYDGGSTEILSTRVNQQFQPAQGDLFNDSVNWQSLGAVVATTASMTVKLSDKANGYVIGGKVRVIKSTATQYDYDKVSNLTTMTDALGNKSIYAYDDLYRLTSLTLPKPEPTSGVPIYNYTYNNAYELMTISDPENRVTAFQYDDLGQMTAVHAMEDSVTIQAENFLKRVDDTVFGWMCQ